MTNLTLNGIIEKDAFKLRGGGGRDGTMYEKLEVTLKKDDSKMINGEDLNIDKLNKLSLLVLKTKDEKYDGIDIKYKITMGGEAEEAKLNSTKVLWLNLENKKPYSSIVKEGTKIENIELLLDKGQPAEEATVEIMVLRKIDIIDINPTKAVNEVKTEVETDTSDKAADTTYKSDKAADTTYKSDKAADTTYKSDKAADTTDYPSGGKAKSERSKKQYSEEQKSTSA
jgi:hypothetical protein